MKNCRHGFTLIEGLIIVIIVGLLAVMVATLSSVERESKVNRTEYPGGAVWTVTHDGHKFVATDGGGILHHPSCSCQDLTPSVISTLP